MDFIKLCNGYKSYLARAEVKTACDSKIYNGLRKVEAATRAMVSANGASMEDLDNFYSKSPANIKLFKTVNVNGALNSYNFSYGGLQDSAKTLDVYNKALHFLTMVKLLKFWMAVVEKDAKATAESVGVSKAVYNRVKFVEDILNISEADMGKKQPGSSTLLYIEMGLKRIISMEVGSDDWDK